MLHVKRGGQGQMMLLVMSLHPGRLSQRLSFSHHWHGLFRGKPFNSTLKVTVVSYIFTWILNLVHLNINSGGVLSFHCNRLSQMCGGGWWGAAVVQTTEVSSCFLPVLEAWSLKPEWAMFPLGAPEVGSFLRLPAPGGSRRPWLVATSLQPPPLCVPGPFLLERHPSAFVLWKHQSLDLKWKVKVKLLSHVQLFATPWTIAHGISQARVRE